jgi:hypothetical protein
MVLLLLLSHLVHAEGGGVGGAVVLAAQRGENRGHKGHNYKIFFHILCSNLLIIHILHHKAQMSYYCKDTIFSAILQKKESTLLPRGAFFVPSISQGAGD